VPGVEPDQDVFRAPVDGAHGLGRGTAASRLAAMGHAQAPIAYDEVEHAPAPSRLGRTIPSVSSFLLQGARACEARAAGCYLIFDSL